MGMADQFNKNDITVAAVANPGNIELALAGLMEKNDES